MRNCFILMPFTKANNLDKADLDYIYIDVLKKAVEAFKIDDIQYYSRVERYNGKVGSIIEGIVKQLNESDLVIADLTGSNPNVMYELGVRHALLRGTIVVSQEIEKLPYDLRDYMTVGYEYSKITTEQSANYKKFEESLHSTIHELISTNKFDSPVLSNLTHRQRFRNEDAIENLKETIVVVDRIKDECLDLAELVSFIDDAPEKQHRVFIGLFNLKMNNLINAINDLNLPNKSPILYKKLLNAKTLLTELNKLSTLTDMFIDLNAHEEVPNGVFGPRDFIEMIDMPIINPFNLKNDEGLQFVHIKELFVENGIIDIHLINQLILFVEQRAGELGVSKEELEGILK